MKLRIIGIFIGVAAIIVCAFRWNLPYDTKREPEYIFTYAENQPNDYPTTLGAYKFAELVQERTNGRIQIIVQPNGVLGDEKAVIQQVQFGGIDFTRVSLTVLSEMEPKLNALQLPYLYRDQQHMWKVLDGDIGAEFLQSLDGHDMISLSWYDAGARNFYNSKRQIATLEDMKELRIRVQESDLMFRMIEALGATPVPMVYDNVYSGLEKNLIDGAENNWPSYESSDHYEVANYYTMDEHTRIPELQLCSKATWDKLLPEDQAILRACAEESAKYERRLWIEQEKKSEQIMIDQGIQIVTLSAKEKERFRLSVQEIYEEFCGDYMDIVSEIIALGE